MRKRTLALTKKNVRVNGAVGAAQVPMEGSQGSHRLPPAQQPGLAAPRKCSGRLLQERPRRGQKWARFHWLRMRMSFPEGRTEMGFQWRCWGISHSTGARGESGPSSQTCLSATPDELLWSQPAKPNLIYFFKAEFSQILLCHHLDTVFKILFPLKKHQSAFLLKSASVISSPEVKQLTQGTHSAMWQIVWKLATKK